MKKMVFSKNLVGHSLTETAQRLRALGVESIDLTVRAGGHVEPDNVQTELPRAAQILADEGISIGMITTNITDARDETTEPILRTARGLGIHYYKLGYYEYKGFGTLRSQRDKVAIKLEELATLNKQIGIRGGFHNHSFCFLGASLWDIDYVLRDIDPQAMGVYLDPAHASIEGGGGGWQQGIDLLQERILMVAVKDYRWIESANSPESQRSKVQWCQLGSGNVRWPEVLKHLHEIGFDGPVSFHSEYRGESSFRDLTPEEILQQTAEDIDVFDGWSQSII